MSEREKLWWERFTKASAIVGFFVCAVVFRIEAIAVYVGLGGLYYGPNVYYQFGPKKE